VQSRPGVFSALLASVLILATFPDVFVSGTSLRLSDQLWGSYENLEAYRAHPPVPANLPWLPVPYGAWLLSYNDIGGAIWQSEPMMEFMRRTVAAHDSPYWDPYSAAGSLGPETLVDLKFSLFTVLYAVLGGGTAIYNALLLAFFWLATYFVVRISRERLRLGILGAVAAGIVYLLNGYSAANIGSNVTLAYLFVPPCLSGLFSVVDARTGRNMAWLTLAFAAFLSFTFLPTTIVATAAMLGCTAGYAVARHAGARTLARTALATMFVCGACLALAFAMLAILYFPIAESFSVTGIASSYSQRTFFPSFLTGALSLFSPSHFFVSSWGNMDPDATKLSGNTIYAFGVLGIVLAASAFQKTSLRRQPLVLCFAGVALVPLARIFAIPGISDAIGLIPIARNLGAQYWWIGVAIPITFLAGIGADNLRKGLAHPLPGTFVLLGGVLATVALAQLYGLREPYVWVKVVSISALSLIAIFAALILWLGALAGNRRRGLILCALVAVLFVELAADARWVRFVANDRFADPTSEVGFLEANAGNYRTMTLGAYATTMDRAGAYGLQEITSLNAGTLPAYLAYFNHMTRALPQQYRFGDFPSLAIPQDAPDLSFYDWGAIDLLGVKYVVVPKSSVQYLAAFEREHFPRAYDSEFTVVFENPHVLPRAFTVDSDVAVEAGNLNLPVDLRDHIEPAAISAYRNTNVEIGGSVDHPAWLVLTDNWHSSWKATLNGEPVEIVRVNATFRGIRVPAGDFRIRMSYQPASLPIAIAVSGAATLVVLALIVTPRRRKSTRAGGPVGL
jgi:hypothetical protein